LKQALEDLKAEQKQTRTAKAKGRLPVATVAAAKKRAKPSRIRLR
jgi:hypothetical protein